MLITKQNSTEVVVEVARTVKVGQHLRIHSSYGYAGIDEGTIEVIAIGGVHELDDEYADTAREFARNELSLLEDTVEYEEHKQNMDTATWIVYKYPSTGEWNLLDLWNFINHTTHC